MENRPQPGPRVLLGTLILRNERALRGISASRPGGDGRLREYTHGRHGVEQKKFRVAKDIFAIMKLGEIPAFEPLPSGRPEKEEEREDASTAFNALKEGGNPDYLQSARTNGYPHRRGRDGRGRGWE